MANDVLQTVLAELRAVGIHSPIVAAGGKHRQVRFMAKGQERMFTVAGTPGDVREVANAKADVRRMLRSLGLLDVDEGSAPARQPSRIELLEQRLARVEARLAEHAMADR